MLTRIVKQDVTSHKLHSSLCPRSLQQRSKHVVEKLTTSSSHAATTSNVKTACRYELDGRRLATRRGAHLYCAWRANAEPYPEHCNQLAMLSASASGPQQREAPSVLHYACDTHGDPPNAFVSVEGQSGRASNRYLASLSRSASKSIEKDRQLQAKGTTCIFVIEQMELGNDERSICATNCECCIARLCFW